MGERILKQHLTPIAQGDVLLIPYHGPLPKNAVVEPIDPKHHGHVLAYGEATGSAHALDTGTVTVLAPTESTPRLLIVKEAEEIARNARNRTFGDVTLPNDMAVLRHVKHPPAALPAKTVWQVVRQVEEIEGVAARVAD